MKIKIWFQTNMVGSEVSEEIDTVTDWNMSEDATFAQIDELVSDWAANQYEFGWSKNDQT